MYVQSLAEPLFRLGVTATVLTDHAQAVVVVGDNLFVFATFDYGQLDRSANTTQIRLNSTVVDVHHAGNESDADQVLIHYMQDDQAHQIVARHVVMACYNAMIPHIVTDLPEQQATALGQQMKSPLIYT